MNYYLNFYNCTISHNNYPQIDRLKSKPFGVPGTGNVVVSVRRHWKDKDCTWVRIGSCKDELYMGEYGDSPIGYKTTLSLV